MNRLVPFETLLGKVLTNIIKYEDELVFVVYDKSEYKMFHEDDWCESVTIEEIHGDLGHPILQAEEVVHGQDVVPFGMEQSAHSESFTWTFYKLATIRGSVTIRWYGESNGYYSENVSFYQIKQPVINKYPTLNSKYLH